MADIAPKRMTVEQLADFLTKSGVATVSPDDLAADFAAGAPKNDDGTVNLLHYAAWLAAKKA